MPKLRTPAIVALLQILFGAGALGMAALVHVPVVGVLGLVVVFCSAVIARLTASRSVLVRKWGLIAAWTGTLLALSTPFFDKEPFTFDDYYFVMTALVAATVLPTSFLKFDNTFCVRWKLLGFVWGILSVTILLVTSCLRDLISEFYVAIILAISLMAFCRLQFKLHPLGIQAVNTIILFLVALPSVDFFVRLHSQLDMDTQPQKYYTYESAKKNPAGYALWTRYYEEQWIEAAKTIFQPTSGGPAATRLRPNSHVTFFRSPISINSLGFRGPEISADKGKTYRIVALGESTTFGVTLTPTDKPWPEVLEGIIRERLKPDRPVEVINAGTPSWDIRMNLYRLVHEILPLKPDMIISYHGYNGFNLIDGVLPPPSGQRPPRYEKRPLKLLADFEYALKLEIYKRHLISKTPAAHLSPKNLMDSEYARAYTDLIGVARSNHIRLVLANFSMAVNTNSDPALIEFYRAAYPIVNLQIKANVAHTAMVRELEQRNPEVIPVDTQPGFDGHHEMFIDLVHLTQPGRQHIAEVMFSTIQKTLEKDLPAREPEKPK